MIELICFAILAATTIKIIADRELALEMKKHDQEFVTEMCTWIINRYEKQEQKLEANDIESTD